MADLTLCGWRVSSDLDLPELASWDGKDRAVEIEIRFGAVPGYAPGQPIALSTGRQRLVTSAAGSVLEIGSVARYWIRGGVEIIVAPCAGASAGAVRMGLLGGAFGLLCHQRGVLPLHAGCVVIDDRAVAIAGPSGIGKSTLTAALAYRGFALVSDDVCVIDWRRPGPLLALPFAPRLKLTRDSLAALDLPPDTAEAMPSDPRKRDAIQGVRRQDRPIPLAAIYHLALGAEDRIRALAGGEAMVALKRNVFRVGMARRLGADAAMFEASARIQAQAPSFKLTRRADLGGLANLAQDLIARHLG